MTKGITPIITSMILILVVILISSGVLYWNLEMGESFRNISETHAETKAEESKTSFMIVNAAGNQVGLKNNGGVHINPGDFSFFLNDTRHGSVVHQPFPPPDTIQPSEIFIFNVTGAYDGNYTVKATGPFGKSDEVFAYMKNP